METVKKLQLFRNFLGWVGGLSFGVKEIIDSLSFLSLLTHFGMIFTEKVLDN